MASVVDLGHEAQVNPQRWFPSRSRLVLAEGGTIDGLATVAYRSATTGRQRSRQVRFQLDPVIEKNRDGLDVLVGWKKIPQGVR